MAGDTTPPGKIFPHDGPAADAVALTDGRILFRLPSGLPALQSGNIREEFPSIITMDLLQRWLRHRGLLVGNNF